MSDALTSISQAAAQVVVASVWQGSLVAATVSLGLRCLPRVSAAHRFVIWSAAFLLVTIMPFSKLLGGSGAVSGKSLQLDAGWGIALALVWLASVIYRATGLLRQTWRVRQIWLKATPLDAPAGIAVLLADCPRQPGLFASTDVDAPSVIGFFSPRLLLPVGLSEQISGAELRQIVLHECEHLRRGDDWLNLLQKVALAVFPLHLALVWMDRRMGWSVNWLAMLA